ncbi:MAG: hypothetical protein EBT07_18405 [Actinobacteria bacterium]|nr:hypothetical protein [Actinomycetota bacterium]
MVAVTNYSSTNAPLPAFHQSPITNYQSPIIRNPLPITNNQLPITPTSRHRKIAIHHLII